VVFSLVGVVVFILGANTAIYFATGSRFPAVLLGSADSAAGARTCADTPLRTQATAVQ
jgi:succinate dehydrogenase / fumarate reductase cytochrome b subunit